MILGTPAADVISGLGGDDSIDGLGGDDSICGDEGDDILDGGDGDDSVRGEEGADQVSGGDGDDVVSGATFYLFEPTGPIPAGPDADDLVSGGSGDDLLIGGPGDDVLDGGDGVADMALYDAASGPITADLSTGTASGDGNDTFIDVEGIGGSIYDDTLIGNGGSNLLFGEPATMDEPPFDQYQPGDDELFGRNGLDGLSGEGGDDLLDGGKGGDFATYFDAPTGVVVDLSAGTAEGWGDDTLVRIENVSGSDHDDTLMGNDRRNFFGPGPGNDEVVGGKDLDTVSFSLNPTSVHVDLEAHTALGEGTDTLLKVESTIGTDFDDTLLGSKGLNFFTPGPGNDLVDGRGGNDCIDFLDSPQGVQVDLGAGTAEGNGSDQLLGINCLSGSFFGDALAGDAEPNLILGYAGNDVISGLEGDDIISGMAGNDVLDGGDGTFDIVDYLAESVTTIDLVHVEANLSAGTATVLGDDTEEADALVGFEGITGTIADDSLTGDGVANYLYGEDGDDVLRGLSGEDWLHGGPGADEAAGGSAFDNCVAVEDAASCEGNESPPEPALLELLLRLTRGFRHH